MTARQRIMQRGLLFVALLATLVRADTLDQQLAQLDRQTKTIVDLTAQFVEEKHTVLLRKPLTSKGKVYVKGNRTRWHTKSPHESTLFTDASRVAVYFPSRNTMEVYPVDRRLRALIVSPVPSVAALRQHFTIEETSQKKSPAVLILRLTPKDPSLAEFIESVRVSINLKTGLATGIEMFDPEGDRTVITFSNIQANVGLTEDDVAWNVPPGTKMVRPLDPESKNDSAASRSGRP